MNGCSDECPLLERILTVPDRSEDRQCLALICMCIDKNAWTHTWSREPLNQVLFPTQHLFVELNFPTVKFYSPNTVPHTMFKEHW